MEDKSIVETISIIFSKDVKFVDEILTYEFSEMLLKLYDILIDNKPRKKFIDFLTKGIESYDKNNLVEAFRNNEEIIKLIQKFGRKNYKISGSLSLRDAINEYFKGISRDGIRHVYDWVSILSSLNNEDKITCLDDLLSFIKLEINEKDFSKVFSDIGDEIIMSGILKENADENTRILFGGIINKIKNGELEWLKNALTKNPEIIKNTKRGSIKDLKVRIKKVSIKCPDDSFKIISQIAQVLNMNLKELNKGRNKEV